MGALRARGEREPVSFGLADAILDDVLGDVRGEHHGHRVGRCFGDRGRAERARRAEALRHWLMRTGIMLASGWRGCGNTAIVPPPRTPAQTP